MLIFLPVKCQLCSYLRISSFSPGFQVSFWSRKLSRRHLVRAPRWRLKCEWTSTASSAYPVLPWLKCRSAMRTKNQWKLNRLGTKKERYLRHTCAWFSDHKFIFDIKDKYVVYKKTCFMCVFPTEQDANRSGGTERTGWWSQRSRGENTRRDGGAVLGFFYELKCYLY